jgi:dCTP deaminase
MILSDREIIAALDRGVVIITGNPEKDPGKWSSTALDLTLDSKLRVWKKIGDSGDQGIIDPMAVDFNATTLASQHATPASCEPPDGFVIEPGTFLLGWTVEKLQPPHTSRIAARVEGKSSLARIGIGVHVTAPTIHAGFGYRPHDPNFSGNPIQLEIWNAGPLRIKLTQGMPICQLIFEEVHGTPNKGYEGRFVIQGPEVPAPESSIGDSH